MRTIFILCVIIGTLLGIVSSLLPSKGKSKKDQAYFIERGFFDFLFRDKT